jgi:hypothetical protein
MPIDTEILRNVLIVTLSFLVLVMYFKRKRRQIMQEDLPAPSHAELISLEVAYHPARLHMVVSLPHGSSIGTALLDEQHQLKYAWPEERFEKGLNALERTLPPVADGIYYVEVSTAAQRTVRQFRLQ